MTVTQKAKEWQTPELVTLDVTRTLSGNTSVAPESFDTGLSFKGISIIGSAGS